MKGNFHRRARESRGANDMLRYEAAGLAGTILRTPDVAHASLYRFCGAEGAQDRHDRFIACDRNQVGERDVQFGGSLGRCAAGHGPLFKQRRQGSLVYGGSTWKSRH